MKLTNISLSDITQAMNNEHSREKIIEEVVTIIETIEKPILFFATDTEEKFSILLLSTSEDKLIFPTKRCTYFHRSDKYSKDKALCICIGHLLEHFRSIV